MKNDDDLVSAAQACALLGVSRATLYSYVSRNRMRAVPDTSDARKSLYPRADILSLLENNRRGRSRRAVAQGALSWGEAAIASNITQIDKGILKYRGQNAIEFAAHATLEDTAELLMGTPIPWNSGAGMTSPEAKGAKYARMLQTTAILSGQTRRGEDWGHVAGSLLYELIGALDNTGAAGGSAHERMAHALDTRNDQLIRLALVLCADHELNASTFAARVTASAGANLPSCVLSCLATLSGARHGGMTPRAHRWMQKASAAPTLIDTTPQPPGFGHPLYAKTDPRAQALIDACHMPPAWRDTLRRIEATHGLFPSLDFGLALVCETDGLQPQAGLLIFAVGRITGWMAHAHEQRGTEQIIRPRAYTP
jgi:citrate synthase